MIASFRHKGLAKFFSKGTKAGIRPEHANRIRLILARLHASKTPDDMNLPGLGFHKLSGEYSGFWAVTVNGNWRIIFRFESEEFLDVNYLDYH